MIELPEQWQQVVAAIRKLGGESDGPQVSPPATLVQVQEIEQAIGITLPDSFREVVLTLSSEVDVRWQLPDTFVLPAELRHSGYGHLWWSLDSLPNLELSRREWIRTVYPDPADDYDREYHGKIAFLEVADGDLLVFDPERAGAVVYLSHDGDTDVHGLVLGADFQDFITRWTRLAFPGPEGWAWKPFHSSASGKLDPGSTVAGEWRSLLRLTL